MVVSLPKRFDGQMQVLDSWPGGTGGHAARQFPKWRHGMMLDVMLRFKSLQMRLPPLVWL